MAYKRVEQPKDSFNENPCWDCVFGAEDGECHAPQESFDEEEECGFSFHGPNYVYIETEE